MPEEKLPADKARAIKVAKNTLRISYLLFAIGGLILTGGYIWLHLHAWKLTANGMSVWPFAAFGALSISQATIHRENSLTQLRELEG